MDIVCDISLRQCKHFLLSRRQFQMLINTLYTGITMTNMELLDNTFEMENQQQPNGEKKNAVETEKRSIYVFNNDKRARCRLFLVVNTVHES